MHPEWFNATAPPRIRAVDDVEGVMLGFFFGVRNLTRQFLLDQGRGVNVGQESLMKHYMQPYVASRSYVYHKKGATLKEDITERNDVLICHRKHMRTNNQSMRVPGV